MGEYRDSFNDIHELEVMAGTELRKTWYETLFSAGYGFDRKTLTTKPVIFPNESYATSFPLHQTTYKENAYVSFYSTASYSLLNRYTVGGSIRLTVPIFSVWIRSTAIFLFILSVPCGVCHKNRLCSRPSG